MIEADFWQHVSMPDENGCMTWGGSRDKDGYGVLKHGGRFYRAHRLAYAIANDDDPGALYVCHACDNPPCCNPDHLWLGDNRANQLDAVAKGRRPVMQQSGQDNGNAKVTEAQARHIIELIASGRKNIEIATAFGLHHATVSAIRRGKSWPDLPRPTNDNFKRYASLRR